MAYGVYYVARNLVLNLSEPDLGCPGLPDLWREIFPASKLPPDQLQCLRCMEERPECPEFMYLRERPVRHAVHWNTNVREHATVESDAHKALKERTAETADRAGFHVEVEDRAPHGHRRTDVTIRRQNGTRLGVEVQLSYITAGSVKTRTKTAQVDGITPLWAVNSPSAHPIHRAPWCRVPTADWRTYRADARLMAQGGIRHIELIACDEMVRLGRRCPVSRRFTPCGESHLDPAPVQVPYDELIIKAAAEEYVPIVIAAGRSLRHFWVPAAHRGRLQEVEAGEGLATLGEAAPAGAPTAITADCLYGQDLGIRARPAHLRDDDSPDGATVSGLCCGDRLPGRKGQPLVLACQLCQHSPTYWRQDLTA